MPIKTLRFPEKQLTVHEVYGDVTFDEYYSTVSKFFEEGVTKFTLWDATYSKGKTMASSELEQFANYISQMAPDGVESSRTAVVVPTDLYYGLTRMFGAFSENKEFQGKIQSFRSRSEAMKWLGVEHD